MTAGFDLGESIEDRERPTRDLGLGAGDDARANLRVQVMRMIRPVNMNMNVIVNGLSAQLHGDFFRREPAAHDVRPLDLNAEIEASDRFFDDSDGNAEVAKRREGHVAGDAGRAIEVEMCAAQCGHETRSSMRAAA